MPAGIFNRIRDQFGELDPRDGGMQTQPEGGPVPMAPPQGGGYNQTQPVGPPTPMGPPQGQMSWARGDAAGNVQQGGYGQQMMAGGMRQSAPFYPGQTPQFPPQRPPSQLPGIKTTPQGGGMSLYGLGMPGAAPVSWLAPPQGRQNAGPWNPFQGGFSGMVRG